ncbi:MAG: class II aldolase/adducin family protein [Bacteroidales bacterium]|nr:class II aldolase/adducin family protein [Bacteroidales bacterium]
MKDQSFSRRSPASRKWPDPTSELPSHLAVHDYLLAKGSPYRASLHTHPIELVALTHSKKWLKKDAATGMLWSMIPETKAFCPRGLGMVPYMLPSSVEPAKETIKLIDEDYDVVIWEKHGVFAVDADIIDAQLRDMTAAFNLPK